jgi:hypothetical protein
MSACAWARHSGQYRVVTLEPKDVIEELFRRGAAGDESVIDELIAEDMVNHAAGPGRQGREGWKQIIATIRTDLGSDFSIEHRVLDSACSRESAILAGQREATVTTTESMLLFCCLRLARSDSAESGRWNTPEVI